MGRASASSSDSHIGISSSSMSDSTVFLALPRRVFEFERIKTMPCIEFAQEKLRHKEFCIRYVPLSLTQRQEIRNRPTRECCVSRDVIEFLKVEQMTLSLNQSLEHC